MPRVSVVIPTYESEKTLARAIDSVLAQTYRDFETIVVDDGSTDGTDEVLNSYGERIRVIRQDNRGTSAARNTGILAARGKYVAFLDSDDFWMPNKLELQLKLLEKNPEVGIVFSDTIYLFGTRQARYFDFRKPRAGHVYADLFIDNFVGITTAIVRRECFKVAGMFDESLSTSEDHDMCLRIARSFKVDFVDEPLAVAVVRKGSVSKNETKLQEDNIALRKKALRQNPILLRTLSSDTVKRVFYSLYRRLSILYLRKGSTKRARERLKEYIATLPHPRRIYLLLFITHLPSILVQGTWELLNKVSRLKQLGRIRFHIYGRMLDYDPRWCELSDFLPRNRMIN